MADDGGGNEPRYPCKVCGRQFFKESLVKHQNVCAKTANAAKKRKVFDSSKQRAEGTDVTLRQIKQAQKKEVAPPKSNWRAKHEDFISTVRAARGVSKAIAQGGPLPPPPPPSINPDYIQCPYCSRRFSQQAAERHINFCKEQSQRVNNRPPPNATAKAKQATRLQYQPPKPKARPTATGGDSPMGSGSGSRIPAPGSRAPPGGAARPGVGPQASRGRAGSYQAVTVAGAKLTPQNHSRNAAVSGYDQDINFLRSTTTISTSTSDKPPGKRADGFIHNPHPKLSSIRGKGLTGAREAARPSPRRAHPRSGKIDQLDRYSGITTEEASFRNNGRREPSFEDDFHVNSGELSPDYDEFSDQNTSSYYSNLQSHHRNGTGFGRNGNKSYAQTSAPVPKFCHECGTQYPVKTAKFCCECGMQRMTLY